LRTAVKMHRIIAAVKKLVVGSVLGVRSALWVCTGAPSFPAGLSLMLALTGWH
jgi:ABC-type xylose transport system permease subunit